MREASIRRARLSALIAAQAAAPAPAAGPLSIAKCKAYALREPVSKRQYAILRLETTGGISKSEIARRLNVVPTSVRRILAMSKM